MINLQTSRINNSRIFRIRNTKLAGFCFYMNTNIELDFQICIGVPLRRKNMYNNINQIYFIHRNRIQNCYNSLILFGGWLSPSWNILATTLSLQPLAILINKVYLHFLSDGSFHSSLILFPRLISTSFISSIVQSINLTAVVRTGIAKVLRTITLLKDNSSDCQIFFTQVKKFFINLFLFTVPT